MLQFKLCILKLFWENLNNRKKLLFSLVTNCLILCWFFFCTNQDSTFLGFDKISLFLIYSVIWCVLMSFTLVNDIIAEANKSGIIEQIFLSSCNIRRYVFIQVILKSLFSVLFITIIFVIVNLITNIFSMNTILSFFLTICIGTFSLLGIGYIIASISVTLNYKNISFLLRLIFLVIIIRFEKNLFIPFTYCKQILVELFGANRYLWNQDISTFMGLVFNSLIYFAIGYTFFAKISSKFLIIKEDF